MISKPSAFILVSMIYVLGILTVSNPTYADQKVEYVPDPTEHSPESKKSKKDEQPEDASATLGQSWPKVEFYLGISRSVCASNGAKKCTDFNDKDAQITVNDLGAMYHFWHLPHFALGVDFHYMHFNLFSRNGPVDGGAWGLNAVFTFFYQSFFTHFLVGRHTQAAYGVYFQGEEVNYEEPALHLGAELGIKSDYLFKHPKSSKKRWTPSLKASLYYQTNQTFGDVELCTTNEICTSTQVTGVQQLGLRLGFLF